LTEPAPRVAQLTGDIACVACGYDLRGLGPRGRCPECGLEIALSYAARVTPAALVDPAWRRHVIEGSVVALAAFFLLFVASLMPTGSYESMDWVNSVTARGFGVVATLSLLAWAMQWYSTLKLGLITASGQEVSRGGTILKWLLSGLASLYLVLPGVALMSDGGSPLAFSARLLRFALDFAGPVAGMLFYLQIASDFRRLGGTGPAAQARMFAFLMPVALGAVASPRGTPWGPLGLFITLPSFQHGRPSMLAYVMRAFASGKFSNMMWVSLPAAVPLCGTYLLVRLLVMTVRAKPAVPAGAADTTPAASGGRNAANSSP
jgi:hypothetical protein